MGAARRDLRHLATSALRPRVRADEPAAAPILLLSPGPVWIRLVALLLGWLVALQYALFIMEESVEHRVQKAGYPAGTAQAVRGEAHADERAEAAARYAARYRPGST